MHRDLVLALALLAIPAVAVAGPARAQPQDATEPRRDFRRRALTIDDANVSSLPELHVAGGMATVLAFQVPLKEGGAFIADVKGLMNPLSQSDRFLVLVPRKDLTAPLPLNVSLADGTVLTFKLVSTAGDADAQVDVVVALDKHAAPESAAALRTSLLSVRAQLDECQAGSATAGVGKIASLFVQQDLDAPKAFERHGIRRADKQNRLLVEARWVYRLLGMTYLVLTVENRDPSKAWSLDRAEVKLIGATTADVKVLSTQTELGSLPPDTSERVVVAFVTPQQVSRQRVSISLFERDGSRHVVLDDLDL